MDVGKAWNKASLFQFKKMSEFAFIVEGNPVAKARARVTKAGTYTPEKTKSYEKQIALIAKMEASRQGFNITESAVEMIVIAHFSPPKSWTKKKRSDAISGLIKKTTKPDLDNIVKSIKDALNGIVYIDDNQVTDIIARKRYGDEPCIQVRVKEIER